MRYFFQFMVILFFCLLGELAAAYIPFPIAGSIWGMVFLLIALAVRLVPVTWVEDVADFFHSFLGLFFIVPAVSVITILPELADIWIYLVLILVITYLVVMFATGRVAELFIKGKK
jgi:holin-like protein